MTNIKNEIKEDGIFGMLPENKMDKFAKKLRDTYAIEPGAPFFLTEFGYFTFERWQKEGFIEGEHSEWDYDDYIQKLFHLDKNGHHPLKGSGWVEAEFLPRFEEKIIEDRGIYEVVQDFAGRKVLCFKGRRNGFMPEYIDHPVKDMKSWETNCKWRLDPQNPVRIQMLEQDINKAVKRAGQGYIIEQMVIGGYMYLRSLIGTVELLYKFYDEPELIHDCMETWFNLADSVCEKHQKHVTLDELFISEDICYNGGSLISPDMIKEFLFPYYSQLITNIKRRQLDKNRKLHIQVDSDGYSIPVIDLYKEIGVNYMSPFEVASGCDVVKVGLDYPELIIRGGIDKRVLSNSKEEIDRYLDGILPAMRKRGGYIPTCDHGVPEEVPFENYMHFRKRVFEYSN